MRESNYDMFVKTISHIVVHKTNNKVYFVLIKDVAMTAASLRLCMVISTKSNNYNNKVSEYDTKYDNRMTLVMIRSMVLSMIMNMVII